MKENITSLGVLILRVYAGVAMIPHGVSKIQMLLEDKIPSFDPIGIGNVASLILSGFAEVVCAALIVIGLFTRFGALALAVNMGVAVYFLNSTGAPWSPNTELSAFYLAAYAALIFTGGKKFALDYALNIVPLSRD